MYTVYCHMSKYDNTMVRYPWMIDACRTVNQHRQVDISLTTDFFSNSDQTSNSLYNFP